MTTTLALGLLLSGCGGADQTTTEEVGVAEQAASTITIGSKLWTGGSIPFRFDSDDFPSGMSSLSPQPNWGGHSACLGLTFPSSSEYLDSAGGGVAAGCQDVRQLLRAMFIWQNRVPGLSFTFDDTPSGDFMEIYVRGEGYCAYNRIKGSSGTSLNVKDHVGNQGTKNFLRLMKSGGCGTAGIIHELGHALGLWHTQGRNDRNAHVTYFPGNMKVGWGTQYLQPSGFTDIGPFEFDSIMLYDSYAGSVESNYHAHPDAVAISGANLVFTVQAAAFDGAAFQTAFFGSWSVEVEPIGGAFGGVVANVNRTPNGLFQVSVPITSLGAGVAAAPGAVQTDPLNYWINRHGSQANRPAMVVASTNVMANGNATFRGGSTLSPGDVGAVFHNYSDLHDDGSPAVDFERYGEALVYGDFDGDGLEDLAVSAPDDDGGVGAVIVYRGSYDATDTGRTVPKAWLKIPLRAWSLASGDLNGDGIDELIVGHDGGTPDEFGGVEVFLGNPWQSFSLTGDLHYSIDMLVTTGIDKPASLPSGFGTNPGARLGHALAVGDLNGDGVDDLAIGLPGADATGYSPANDPASPPSDWPNNYLRTGAALVYFGVASADVTGKICDETSSCAEGCDLTTGFCHTTTACTVDSDCGNGQCDSSTLHCSLAPLRPMDGVVDPYLSTVKGSHNHAEFGATLAIADLNMDGFGDLIVGAPQDYEVSTSTFGGPRETLGDHTSAPVVVGQVHLFELSTGSGVMTHSNQLSRNVVDSEFGAALTLTASHLFVGAPGSHEDPAAQGDRVGAVYVYDRVETLGSASSFVKAVFESDFLGCVREGDRFGAALAAGEIDSFTAGESVAIGAPSKNVTCSPSLPFDAGEGAVYLLRGTLTPGQRILSPSPTMNLFGRFGAALAYRQRNSHVTPEASVFTTGQLELAVGAPGEAHTTVGLLSGVAWRIEGTATTVTATAAVEQR
ncbi:MAG: M12 family metallopeptidase [Polyangiaceae bacterium]